MKVKLDALRVEAPAYVDVNGVRWKLTDLKRWHGSAPMRTQVDDLPLNDGGFAPERSYRSAKRMSLEGICTHLSADAAEEYAWDVLAALSPEGLSMPLSVETGIGVRTMTVWLDGEPEVVPYRSNGARFRVPIVAPDPRKYGPYFDLTPTGPSGDSDTGLIFPLFGDVTVGRLDFGTFAPTGLVTLTNTGKATSWASFKVRGGIAAGGFQIVSGADILEYNAAVAVGEEVSLSPYAGGRATIGDTDVSDRLVQADWPGVRPGETRVYVFNPLGAPDGNAQMTTLFREAWW